MTVSERVRARDPRLIDGLVALVLAVGLELQLLLGDDPEASAVGVVAGLALTLPLAWRRRAPLLVVLVFAGVAALQGALGGEVFSGEPPLLAALVAGAVAFYSLGAYAEERVALLGAIAGVLGLWLTVIVSDHRDLQSFLLSAGVVGLSPWLAGRATRARTLRTLALERERDQRAQLAVGEERQRIARELHDVVAHGVVTMVVQAQGARRILDHDPERARAALHAIEETGQTALSEIRRSLGVLRQEPELRPQPTLADLDALVAEMRAAGLEVRLDVDGSVRSLPDGVERTAYRIVQEALTNTLKHAGLVPTRVTVAYAADELTLEIADEGPGPSEETNGGHGLLGMRERVRLHGGELEAQTQNGHGFVVRARIPLAP